MSYKKGSKAHLYRALYLYLIGMNFEQRLYIETKDGKRFTFMKMKGGKNKNGRPKDIKTGS